MHDFYYEKLLADPKNFQPRSGSRYIELQQPAVRLPDTCFISNTYTHSIGRGVSVRKGR